LILIVMGILSLINFVGYRHFKRIDLTEQKHFSLAPQSIKVVKALQEDVRVLGFFKDKSKGIFVEFMEKYAYHSKRVKAQFVDADKEVALSKQYNVKKYGTVIVEKGKRQTRFEGFDYVNAEEKLTNAIIKVGKEKDPKVYFTKGHLEKGITDQEREGFSVVKAELEKRGYVTTELLLLESGVVPKDCDLLIIAGPEKSFLSKEVQVVENYLKSGGKLLVMLDPQKRKLGLERLLKKIGIDARNDLIVDPVQTIFGQGAATPVVSSYSEHKIVQDMKIASYFPLSRSLVISNETPRKNIQVEPLATTSRQSWGIKNGLNLKKIKINKDRDRKGPLNLAVVASGHWDDEKKGEEMRVVVYGDSDFVNNRTFRFSGNSNFFLNAVAWLVDDESSISIRPQTASMGRLIMTPRQISGVLIFSVVLLPLFIIGSGLLVWWRRRKLA